MTPIRAEEAILRKLLLITLTAATALTTPGHAFADHGKHGRYEARHDGRHDRKVERKHRRNYVVYAAPYPAWRYRPVYVGYRLRPSFWGTRYVITDYGAFRVRAPSRWQRWIRYGDDLLLVNIRTGRVLRILPNAFW